MSEDEPMDPFQDQQTTGIVARPAKNGKVVLAVDGVLIEGTYFDAIELAQTLVASAVISAKHIGADPQKILATAWHND